MQAAARLHDLRAWLAGFDQPGLEVVGCAEHQALARELAERSVTLVRDDDGLLPLRLSNGARICVVEPPPRNLTPADTSVLVEPTLATAVRLRWPATDAIEVSADPTPGEIGSARDRVASYDLAIVGTAAAHLAYVAAGRLDAFWEPGLNAWDVAAGILLVEEAGGRVSTYTGQPMTPPGGDILATNGPLHPTLLERVSRRA